MRRHLLSLALLSGLLAPAPPHAAAALARAQPASSSHAGAHHGHTHPARHRPSPARRHGSRAVLQHARRKPARLRLMQPVTTALIDPVPRGKFSFPPPLKGNRDSLLRQNARSQQDGLERVQDDAGLLALRRQKQLVALPVTAALAVDERLPANRRYCRVWTAEFLDDLSRVHNARFHRPLQVNSAVRTVDYQRHLELVNGNAAPADGDNASPHLTGATVDIAKKGLSMAEIGWIRAYLMPLQAAGKIDVEEEFYQSCFHISVYRSYRPDPVASPEKSRVGSKAALLAAGVR